MPTAKALKIIITLNIITGIMAGIALFLYFAGIVPKITSLIILAIALPLELSERYFAKFAKDDPRAQVFAKTSGLTSMVALLLILFL